MISWVLTSFFVVWPSFLVWSPLWLYASSVKKKYLIFYQIPLTWSKILICRFRHHHLHLIWLMTWKIRKIVGMEMNANLTHNVAKKENAKKIMGKLTKIQSTFSILLFGQKKKCKLARQFSFHILWPLKNNLNII